jgi:methionyl-tRNA synthetase
MGIYTNKFYITTPIYYVNDKPHIGHAYTTIVADIIARWHRLKGEEVFFLTGTDEHGEKIEKAAEESKMTPQEFVDKIVEQYKTTWKKLNISYDYFIRTTDKKHIDTVEKFIGLLIKAGDVYSGEYEGWYCVPDETFFTDLQLKNGKCPECGRGVAKLKEKTHFFKLSAYQQRLLDFYKANPRFLSPNLRATEIVNRVTEGLKDISITRATVKWGVSFDTEHTVYVWVDALLNYISALDWPNGEKFNTFWPADVHIIGKEINWFHSVIWPAMLFSAGLEAPKKVFAHGWWTSYGKKMSKSMHNFVDPIYISDKYSTDVLRYFLIKEMPFGNDGDFSIKSLEARINGELVSDYGNLIYRVLTLTERYKGKIEGKVELDKTLNLEKINNLMQELDLFNAINEIWDFIRSANKYINENEVWKLEGMELGTALYNLLEACRITSILLYPFMPETSEKVAKQLGTDIRNLEDCKFMPFNGSPKKGAPLFKKIEKNAIHQSPE